MSARVGLLVASLAGLALAAGAAPTAAAASGGILDLPVTFQVKNTNTSQQPCPSDGKTYLVRGHLTGPASAIKGPAPRAVTLYYQGFESGEWNWRFRAVPGYDYSNELAKMGLVSVTVDQLGYGASDHPYGFDTCVGSQVDIAHQIIQQLRSRTYTLTGMRPVEFSKVVFAGHDIGGAMAEIEAYSYHDIDGLMVFTWQEQGFTPYITQTVADANARCAAGGESAYPSGPGGYIYYPHLEDWPLLLQNTDPDVLAGAVASRLRNPCGIVSGGPVSVFLNGSPGEVDRALATIDVPVLLVLGALDPVFTHDGFSQQAAHFSHSPDVTSVLLPDTPHWEMLGRTAPRFRALTADWLRSRGFVSAATG